MADPVDAEDEAAYGCAAPPSLVEQLPWLDVEVGGDLVDDGDGGVAGTALEIADIGAVNAGLMREGLLRQTLVLTQAPQVVGKALSDIDHGREDWSRRTIGLQTIRDIVLDFTA